MSVVNMNELKAFFTFFYKHRLDAVRHTKAWALFGAPVTQHKNKVLGWRQAERVPDSSVREAMAPRPGTPRSAASIRSVTPGPASRSPATSWL